MKQFDYNKYLKNNPLLKEGYTPDERIYVGKPAKTGPLAVASDYLYSMEKALKQLDRVIDKNPNISAKEVITMVLNTLQKVKDAQKKGDPSFQGDFSMNEARDSKDNDLWFVDANSFINQSPSYELKPTDRVSIGNDKVMTYADAMKKYGSKQAKVSKSTGASLEKVASYILKQLEKNYTDEELQNMSRQDAIDTVESYGFKGPEVEEIVDMIYMML